MATTAKPISLPPLIAASKGGIPFSHRHRGHGADTADGQNFAKLDREWKAILEKEVAEAWVKVVCGEAAANELAQAAAVLMAWIQERLKSNPDLERGDVPF